MRIAETGKLRRCVVCYQEYDIDDKGASEKYCPIHSGV